MSTWVVENGDGVRLAVVPGMVINMVITGSA